MKSFRFAPAAPLIGALSTWPCEWVRGLLRRQAIAQRKAIALAEQPSPEAAARLADAVRAWQASGIAAGFDLARAQYAAGVQAGLVERSLLASAAFERGLGLLERLTLGPWARTV